MWKDLALYIIRSCGPTDRVVEVGAGRFFKVAEYIKKHSEIDLILTDIKPSHVGVTADDITDPRLDIYRAATLIYSLRPPVELHEPLLRVADKVGARLIIKPLHGDYISTSRSPKLVNFGKTFFYEYEPLNDHESH